MGIKLFIDDQKEPEWFDLDRNELIICRTSSEARKYLHEADVLYLDYDLDIDGTKGIDLIDDFWGRKIYLISLNQDGGIEKMIRKCLSKGIDYEDITDRMMDKMLIMGE